MMFIVDRHWNRGSPPAPPAPQRQKPAPVAPSGVVAAGVGASATRASVVMRSDPIVQAARRSGVLM